MRALKRERQRLQEAVQEGTATREDREILTRSKNLEKDLEAADKRDIALQSARDTLRDKLDQAKHRLRDLALKIMGVTHVYKVTSKKDAKNNNNLFRKVRPSTERAGALLSSSKRRKKTR